MIHDIEVKALKVGDFTRDVHREDLAQTIEGRFRAERETFGQQAAFCRTLAVRDDSLLCI